ncbi:MAG: sugar phosphate isomerase/epimerase [Oscillospiraceae bacterium]|nr:sugar phosphate isomerase/epimerase [Oscillospiraceae bacterium]
MKIGISTAAYYGALETEDAAARLAALGVDCCEVFLETFSEYTPGFAALVRARLGNTRAVSVHNRTIHFEWDLVGQSARQRTDALHHLRGFCQAGQVLGAGIYVFHGPGLVRGQTPNLAAWQEGLEEAMQMAADHGLTLAWETVSWCALNTPGRVRELLAVWPNLRFVLDIKQVLELGQNPVDYVEAMGDRLCHLHMLDFDARGRHALPGSGAHDFKDLAAALRLNGYQGDIILEPYGSMRASDEALLASVRFLRERFQAE